MKETFDLQDHILPYALDERHVEDTLFIVVEEDFRFFDEGQGEPIAPEPKLKASQAFLQSALEPTVAARFQSGQEKAKLTALQAHWQTRVCTRRPQKDSSLKQLRRAFLHNQSDQSNHGGVGRREPIASS